MCHWMHCNDTEYTDFIFLPGSQANNIAFSHSVALSRLLYSSLTPENRLDMLARKCAGVIFLNIKNQVTFFYHGLWCITL